MGTTAERSSVPIPATAGGWVELGRTTLGSAGDTITVSSLADKRYLMVLGSVNQTGGDWRTFVRLNGDTGSNYSQRYNQNGGADLTNTSLNGMMDWNTTNTTSTFEIMYFANYSSKEKLGIKHKVGQSTAGATTAPIRGEMVGKHVQTSNPISSITLTDAVDPKAGSANTGSEVVVLGWDPSDTHTTNFWEELASVNASGSSTNLSSGTITAKKYLWIQLHTEGSTNDVDITFNNDTGSNYAQRWSINGGTETTVTSQTQLRHTHQSGVSATPNAFSNWFIINNASNEKLGVVHNVVSGTAGAGTAPQRGEFTIKWANTSNQITEIDVDSAVSNFGTNSFLKVWGAD